MRLYICLFLSFSCYWLSAQQSSYSSVSMDGSLTKNANAVIRLEETIIDLASQRNLKFTYKKIVTVLNKKGNLHLDMQVYYDDKIDIRNLGATVYNKLGKEIHKFRSGDFKDVAAVSSFSLYEDSRIKYLNYSPKEYPYTVEFYYETSSSNTAWVPFWRPLKGYDIYTEKSTYNILYNASMGFNIKAKNFSEYTIIDQSREGHISYIAENLKAITAEELSPGFDSFSPVLMAAPKSFYYEGYTGEATDWENLGKWIHDNLLAERAILSEETRQMVRNLVEGVEDPIEKARIIYTYVQENTRYISVQVGIGGIQPISAAEVDKVKYGDCKGLTNYTKALLEVAGVKSNYTEVFATAREQRNIDRDFPTLLGQANHVILNIPIDNSESVWLECTSQTMPFGFLGDFTDDRDVLSISAEGGKIIRTPKYMALKNSQITKAVLNILSDNGIEAEVSVVSKGIQYDKIFNIERKESRDQYEYYKNRWAYIRNITIRDLKFENDRENIVFTEKIDFVAENYAINSANLLLFSPNVLNRNAYTPSRYRDRKLPLKIERGFMDEDFFEINLPQGYEIDFIPENISLENKYGKYIVNIEKISETKLKYMRVLTVNEGLYPKEEYDGYRDFIREVSKNDNAKIVLIQK